MRIRVFMGLGSNLGDRLGHLRWAVDRLAADEHIFSVRASPVYESEAHVLEDEEDAPAYLNAVLSLETTFAPEALLKLIHLLEAERGRNREGEKRWASRALDLDILAYGEQSVSSRYLQIPHRRLDQRMFVLAPWADLAPGFRVPAPFDETVENLKESCTDTGALVKTTLNLLD